MKTDVPPGRYGHTATISGDYMYIFGGQGRYGAMNDLWVFDFVRATWSPLDAIGEAPRERFGHCACVSENVLFIFGGKDARPGMNVESFDDLYGFDIAEREWLHIESRYGRPSGGERVRFNCGRFSVARVESIHALVYDSWWWFSTEQ